MRDIATPLAVLLILSLRAMSQPSAEVASVAVQHNDNVFPEKVSVLADLHLPIPFSVDGLVQPVKAGAEVTVKSAHGDKIKISYGAGEGMIDQAKTDFSARLEVAQQEFREKTAKAAEQRAKQERDAANARRAARDAVRNSPAVSTAFTDKELNDAYYAARNAFKNILKSPSSAEFSNPHLNDDTGAEADGFGRIICKGYVDAQNSFGATIRTYWRAWVQPEGASWRLVRAMLDGEVLRDERNAFKTEPLKRAEVFLGMTREEMLSEFGEPVKVGGGHNSEDGPFKTYCFDETKGRAVIFTIWERDGVVSGGIFQGVWFGPDD